MNYQILQGDNRETLKTIPDNSIDAIVTDPPYGIDFLGKAWDANTGALETYQECLRVLKPGGHILAFSAARTYHHLAVTLEQAGFEIRDQIMWIYSSGFPKSQDVGKSIQRSLGVKETKKNTSMRKGLYDNTLSEAQGKERVVHADYNDVQEVVPTDPEAKQWSGWGTCLKPAHEPIALARKPTTLTFARNCQTHGVGALNIDATRVPYESKDDIDTYLNNKKGPMERAKIADGKNIGMFDGGVGYKAIKRAVDPAVDLPEGRFPSNVLGEIEGYQKYFYCPKVSSRERMEFNNHPTVKPIELMKYLIKLITPAGGTVLDPFNGSGSTGCAAVELGHPYIGCELDPAYVEIAQRRIEAWYAHANPTLFNALFDTE